MVQFAPDGEAARIARFMGLRRWQDMDDLRLADMVADGLPVSTVETIVKKLDPVGGYLAIHDLVPRATYYRRKEARQSLTKDQSEMVFAMAKLFSEVTRLFQGDISMASMFLSRPHPMLGGRSPLDVAKKSTAGTDAVLALLARADAGIAA